MEYSGLVFSSLPLLFTVSEIAAWFLTTGGKVAFIVLLGFSGLVIYRSRNRFIKKNQFSDPEETVSENDCVEKILKKCGDQLIHFLSKTSSFYTSGIDSFIEEDLPGFKNIMAEKENLKKKVKKSKENIFSIAIKFESSLHSGHYLIDLKDYQVRMINSLTLLLNPLFEHLSNSHKPFINVQGDELAKLGKEIENFLDLMAKIINNSVENDKENLAGIRNNIFELLNSMEVAQINRIKTSQVNTRNSILFLNILSETKNMLNHASGLLNSYIKLISGSKN
jgi:Na+/phosphate symporter